MSERVSLISKGISDLKAISASISKSQRVKSFVDS